MYFYLMYVSNYVYLYNCGCVYMCAIVCVCVCLCVCVCVYTSEDTHSVMAIIIGNGHGNQSSNPG